MEGFKAAKKKKRIRSPIPSYKKVYSTYQYDRNKFAQIYKRIQKLALIYDYNIFYRTNPYRVLDLCYQLDQTGNRQSLGDEKHIFRYRALQNVLKEIGDYLVTVYEFRSPDVLKYLFNKTHLIIYKSGEYNQAELLETISLPIKVRLKTHIALLRYLKNGYEIEDAVELTRKTQKVPFLNLS